MESITSSQVCKSLQSYWRRRAYRRLEDETVAKKAVVSLGGSGKRRWRPLKVAAARPVLRLRRLSIPAPRKLMARLRNAYMDVMLLLAGGGGVTVKKVGGGHVWDRRVPRARQASLRAGDFEKRVLQHLYSSVIATR